MKKIIIHIIVLFVFCGNISCKEEIENPVEEAEIIPSDFSERTYNIYIPESIEQNENVPLVFVFHGANGNGAGMERGTGFNQLADAHKFIVCYPDAATENWEEGCMCNKPYRLGIDDIGFINYLIDKLSGLHKIDSKKIFAAGYSQGGLFAQNVACKLSNKFAAVAAVASSMSVQLYQGCDPKNKISLLMIHGTRDNTLPFNGLDAGSFSLVSTPSVFNLWGKFNECNSETNVEILPDKGDQYISVIKRTYQNCSGNVKTILYEVEGGGHSWFTSPDINATTTIVDFFMSSPTK